MRKLVIAVAIGILIGQMFPLGMIQAMQAYQKMATTPVLVKFQVFDRNTRRPLLGNFTIVGESYRPNTLRIVASGRAERTHNGVVTTWAKVSCSSSITKVVSLVQPLLK